jgi:hypothetical protein
VFNGLLVASNGTDSRVGSLTADWERFFEWKRIEREDEVTLAGKIFKPPSDRPIPGAIGRQGDDITGDELLAFINNEEAVLPNRKRGPGLFAYFPKLTSDNGSPIGVTSSPPCSRTWTTS